MSKKSRKRNKKILAAIGIGLGAAALASRNKRNASIQANEAKEAGSAETGKKFEDQSYSTGPKKDTAKSDVAPVAKKVNNNIFRTRGRITDSSGNTIPSETKTNYVKNARINALNTSEGSPMIDNPYKRKPSPQKRGTFKSGGKVKGCGKALRGFGKAMKGKR